VNSELANNLGNFVKRVSDLLHKFYDGKLFLNMEWYSNYKNINFSSFDSTGNYTKSISATVIYAEAI
jgi:methionyl-tRNA synthetase